MFSFLKLDFIISPGSCFAGRIQLCYCH